MAASFRRSAHPERRLLAILYISIHIIAIAPDRPNVEFFPSEQMVSIHIFARSPRSFAHRRAGLRERSKEAQLAIFRDRSAGR